MQNDAEHAWHYRALAAETRAKAYAEADPERRAHLLQLAASYIEIAEHGSGSSPAVEQRIGF